MQCFTSPQRPVSTLHPWQARAGWPDRARYILPSIYDILPNYK